MPSASLLLLTALLSLHCDTGNVGQENQPLRSMPLNVTSDQQREAIRHRSANNQEDEPSVPLTGQTAAGFAPQEWRVLAEAEGDLNGDGRSDAVAVFSKDNPSVNQSEQSENDLETSRLLVIALRDNQGQLRRDAISQRAILCRRCGGMYDKPLLTLTIGRDGTITIEQNALGVYDTTYIHEVRKRQGRWSVISGRVISRERRSGRVETTRQHRPIPLGDFDISQVDAPDSNY